MNTETQNSRLILNGFTCIDHAKIIPSKFQAPTFTGGSYNAIAVLGGRIEKRESVIIDFSKCKKLMKAVIDDGEVGIDHKLWVFLKPSKDSPVDTSIVITKNDSEGWTLVRTPFFSIRTDTNAVVVFDYYDEELTCVKEYIVEEIKTAVRKEIDKDLEVDLELYFNVVANGVPGQNLSYFSYAHGLKSSSSYGCQNIAHGHLSYLTLLDEDYQYLNVAEFPEAVNKFVLDIDGTYFISRENVVRVENGMTTVAYESNSRGYFEMTFDNNKFKHKILDTETTIEYLIKFFYSELKSSFPIGSKAKHMIVSEGLTKGAVIAL